MSYTAFHSPEETSKELLRCFHFQGFSEKCPCPTDTGLFFASISFVMVTHVPRRLTPL